MRWCRLKRVIKKHHIIIFITMTVAILMIGLYIVILARNTYKSEFHMPTNININMGGLRALFY